MLAIERSRASGARSLELRAAMSLARLWQDDRGIRLMRGPYEGFTEGHATADLLEARRLCGAAAPDAASHALLPAFMFDAGRCVDERTVEVKHKAQAEAVREKREGAIATARRPRGKGA